MTTPAFAVNWWQVGWIVANNVIDRVVNLDEQSSNDQYSTYMVSPSIVFNNGTNGGGRILYAPSSLQPCDQFRNARA